jgi:hypothetical protein
MRIIFGGEDSAEAEAVGDANESDAVQPNGRSKATRSIRRGIGEES